MKGWRPRSKLMLSLAAGLICACAEKPARPELEPLRVLAAASTTDLFSKIAESYEGATLRLQFGPSSQLARQIRDGAPADLFVSANRAWVDYLDDEGLLGSARAVLCRGRLWCVAPKGSSLAQEAPASARELLQRISTADRVGVAGEGVPAGDYTRQSLQRSGVLEAYRGILVGQLDVRAVLRAVEAQEMVAGFVYASDLRAAEVEPLFALDSAGHDPIEYHVAILADCRDPQEAARLLDYLGGETVAHLLHEAGFESASPPRQSQ